MADANANTAPEVTAPSAPAPVIPAPPSIVPGIPVADATDKVKEIAASATQTLNNFKATSSGSIILIVIAGTAVALLTAYALYWVISSTVLNQSSYLMTESKMPLMCTEVHSLNGDSIPNAANGHKASMSFWMYIHDINKYSGTYRHVFHRGTATDACEVASPMVRLDPQSSALTIGFSPLDSSKAFGTSGLTSSSSDDEKWKYITQARGITFSYIPLQRWVHVAVVVNEDLNGGTITGYIDGELVQTVNSMTSMGPNVTYDVNNIDLNHKGNVYAGGSVSDPIGPGFSGLISKIQFWNYDMNANDVYENYKKGPLDSILAKMGLPAYGVQAPIYKIG